MTGSHILQLIRHQLGGALTASMSQFPDQELIDHLNQAQRHVQLIFDAYAPNLMCDYAHDAMGNLPPATAGKAEYVLTTNVMNNWGDYFSRPRAIRWIELCTSNSPSARTGVRLPRLETSATGALLTNNARFWSGAQAFSPTLSGKGVLFAPAPATAQRYYIYYNQYAPDWTTTTVADGTLLQIPDAYADLLVAIAAVHALRKHDQEATKRAELMADIQRMEQALAARHTGQVTESGVYARFFNP